MEQKKIEYRALLVGIVSNILMGAAGRLVYFVTQINALFLDAAFICCLSCRELPRPSYPGKSKKTSKTVPHGIAEFGFASCKNRVLLLIPYKPS